jgi:hypothetical protein
MASSPTQRSLAYLRDIGYEVEVVERWNPFAKRRQDLFGFVDILCVKDGETLGVQTTSDSNVAARIRKIEDSPMLFALRRAGWRIEVHGWKRDKSGSWRLRVEDVS